MYLARTKGHKWSKVQLLIGVIGPSMLAQLDVVSGSFAAANVGACVGSHGKTYSSSTATPKDTNKNGVENYRLTVKNTHNEEKLQMALWALSSAPLFMSNHVPSIPAASRVGDTLTARPGAGGRYCFVEPVRSRPIRLASWQRWRRSRDDRERGY